MGQLSNSEIIFKGPSRIKSSVKYKSLDNEHDFNRKVILVQLSQLHQKVFSRVPIRDSMKTIKETDRIKKYIKDIISQVKQYLKKKQIQKKNTTLTRLKGIWYILSLNI